MVASLRPGHQVLAVAAELVAGGRTRQSLLDCEVVITSGSSGVFRVSDFEMALGSLCPESMGSRWHVVKDSFWKQRSRQVEEMREQVSSVRASGRKDIRVGDGSMSSLEVLPQTVGAPPAVAVGARMAVGGSFVTDYTGSNLRLAIRLGIRLVPLDICEGSR